MATPNLECRMYEIRYPEVKMAVMIQVKSISEMCAYVSLLEFNNMEGMIIRSELSPERFRRIARTKAVTVLHVDEEKDFVTVSRSWISERNRQICEARYHRSKLVHSILRDVAETLELDLEDMYIHVGWPLYRKYGHAFEAFKLVCNDPDSILNSLTREVREIDSDGVEVTKVVPAMTDEVKDSLIKNIRRRMNPRPFKIQADVEIKCFELDGVLHIKDAMWKAEAAGNTDCPVKFNVVGSPSYVLITHTLDKEQGISILKKAIAICTEEIECHKGTLIVKEEPRVVNKSEDELLAEETEKLYMQNDPGWDSLIKGIMTVKNIPEGLQEPQLSSEDYTMIYTTIDNMCKPPRYCLYDKYRKSLEEYITSTVLPSLREKHDEVMLRELVKRWSNHKVMISWLSQFCHHLDRYFIARKSLPALNKVGLTCFRVLVYQELNAKVRDAVISLMDQERKGKRIDTALLKNVLDIFVKIGMSQMDYYENDFEEAMLKDTAAYYSQKASNWIKEDSCPDYMLKAEECLKFEKDRVSHYLHVSSEPKLLERVQHELLSVYATQLLQKEHSGCLALLRDDKVDNLSRMYRLFSNIPRGLYPVSDIFKQHVTAEVTALVKQAEDAASDKKAENKDVVGLQEQVFVRKVIELHGKYLAHVKDCFTQHTLFRKALQEAFVIFCNMGVTGSSSAELLATFCDNILKKGGSEKLSDEAIEETLKKVVNLIVYIGDQDLFAQFYRQKFARRLLFDESANDMHERSFLTKLKQEWGDRLTSKMDGMVTDLTLAKENQSDFEEYLGSNPNVNTGIDFTVTVLSTDFWPSFKSFNLNLPAEMVKCVEVFGEFYQTKTKRKKLEWIYSLGTCNINGNFDPKTIELIVTTYQAAALLLFNSSDRLSYQEIMTKLNLLDDDHVVRLLHSLSCGKYKILTKEPNTGTISPDDFFEFNSKFTHKMGRIKIPPPPVDEKKKVIEDVFGKKKVIEHVFKDRRYAIDALIVRIMKRVKVLGYEQLVMECVEQLDCKPDVKEMKKRIEDLISREYLERDGDDPTLLKYVPS